MPPCTAPQLRPLSALTWLLLLLCAGCTDTNLYSPHMARKEANRLALSGRVCTEDPTEARFPLRIILLVDQAAGPLFSTYDPAAKRVSLINDFVYSNLNNPEAAFAIIGYGGRPRKFAPVEGAFTRNPGEIIGAVASLSLAQPCLAENQCRDYREALRTARTLVEDDAAALPAGLRVLTQYVIVIVNAGPHSPLARDAQCCAPTDVACINQGNSPSAACEAALGAQIVEDLVQAATYLDTGGVRVHTLHLASQDSDTNDEVADAMRAIAFAGGGIAQRFNAVDGITLAAIDTVAMRTPLQGKLVIAANLNAVPGPDGPRLDSDADGLPDDEEARIGTNPRDPDTDQDGISDFVEVLTGLDPNTPDFPTACANLIAAADQDLDRLSDCDEAIIGTEATLVDTDGDGLPDFLELIAGTDYLNPDAELDYDNDGVPNGEEVRQRTDPRSTDTRTHLSHAYRYEIIDEGFVRELFPSRPRNATGVTIVAVSPGTTAGVGLLVYQPDPPRLQWQDAADTGLGPATLLDRSGTFDLPSSSWAPIQGESGKTITVRIERAELPTTPTNEQIRVIYRDRHCLQYTVRNVRLMPTLSLDSGFPRGYNSVMLYLAEAPSTRLNMAGPFRMAEIPVIYDPPRTRSPDDAIIGIDNDEWVRPRILMRDR